MNARQRRRFDRAVRRAAAAQVEEARAVARNLLQRFWEPVCPGYPALRGVIEERHARELWGRLG